MCSNYDSDSPSKSYTLFVTEWSSVEKCMISSSSDSPSKSYTFDRGNTVTLQSDNTLKTSDSSQSPILLQYQTE
jgi:hypothetical protein